MTLTARILALAAFVAVGGCSVDRGDEPRREPQHRVTFDKEAATPKFLMPAGRVTDAAHLLSESVAVDISDKLEKLEHQTGHQLAVVTVPSLGGADIANYTRDLANRWGVGRKGVNDGVVLLVAPRERLVRIAVGDGLRAKLPDDACQAIIDQIILPRFRKGDLTGGMVAGIDELIAKLGDPASETPSPR